MPVVPSSSTTSAPDTSDTLRDDRSDPRVGQHHWRVRTSEYESKAATVKVGLAEFHRRPGIEWLQIGIGLSPHRDFGDVSIRSVNSGDEYFDPTDRDCRGARLPGGRPVVTWKARDCEIITIP